MLQLVLAWIFLPALWAGLYTIALPFTGYYCVLYSERMGRTFRRLRTFLYFLFNRRAQGELIRENHEILQSIYDLAGRLPTPPAILPLPPITKERV